MSSLLLAPHNDDETLFASFLCLRFKPFVIIVLASETQKIDGITAAQREAETACAMEVLGCDWEQFPIGDRRPNWRLVETMLNKYREVEQVFVPAFEQLGHRQHNELSLLAQRIFGTERCINYLTYTSAGKSAWGEPVPFETEWVGLKLEALACYQSQLSHPKQVAHFMRDWYEYVA